MKPAFAFSVLLLFLKTSLAQVPEVEGPDGLWLNASKAVVEFMASDSMRGRAAGSPQEMIAADFITRKLAEYLKVKPKRQVFEFLAPDSAGPRTAQNVFAYLNNHAEKTILIGAHYDHIGMGGNRSLSFGKREVHNGADDNASGVALLLALARSSGAWVGKGYNYLFVAYSAHEVGLFGSAAFLAGLRPKYKELALVINFDMVGRMHPRERWLKVFGAEKDSLLQAKVKEGSNLNFRFDTDAMLDQLDTRAFRLARIPCLSFTTGIHDDYHKVSDDAKWINYQGIWEVQLVAEHFLTWFSKAQPSPVGSHP